MASIDNGLKNARQRYAFLKKKIAERGNLGPWGNDAKEVDLLIRRFGKDLLSDKNPPKATLDTNKPDFEPQWGAPTPELNEWGQPIASKRDPSAPFNRKAAEARAKEYHAKRFAGAAQKERDDYQKRLGEVRQVVDPADADLAQQRMAVNRVVEEVPVDVLDSLVQDAKDEAVVASLLDDAFEYLELKRQRDSLDQIHGASEAAAFLDPNNPSQTTEQQIGRQLVMSGIEPAFIPADRILGRDVSVNQSGIDGEFKDDSEVRRHVTGSFDGDDLELDRSDVYTEFMSPTSRREVWNDWAPNQRRNQDGRGNFNAAVSEYYGQQALRLRGATPVPDHMRSGPAQWADRDGKPSTVGTDRLIENSAALTDRDIAESGDFRYLDNDGRLVVGDNQAGNLTPDNVVNFNLLKNSNINLGEYGADNFKARLAQEAQELQAAGLPYTLDDIFGSLMDKGELAPLTRAYKPGLTRAGKVLSGQPQMGAENPYDQYRYDKILYPVQERGALSRDEGYLPEKFRMFDTTAASKVMGELLADPTKQDKLNFFQKRGQDGIYAAMQTNEGSPEGYLRDSNLNRQFSEGYSF